MSTCAWRRTCSRSVAWPRRRSRAVSIRNTSSWLLRFLAFGSGLQTILLVGFFLVPFSHLWGLMPPVPPEAEAAPRAPDWGTALTVALIFALPSLLPFALLIRLPEPPWDARLTPLQGAVALGLVLLPSIVALGTYPCCTSDVLDYVNRQRLWVVYGGNPFAITPNDHPEDWSYYFANFKDSVFGYGPAWWLMARAFTQWAAGLDQYLLGFKLLAGVCFAVSSWLIWRLADQQCRLFSLTFFAWNPVVLIDGVLRLHNDLLTVPFVLGAVWLWQRRQPAPSLAMVGLGALVKVTVAPLGLALAATLIRRRRWRALALGIVAGLLVVALLYAPFWYGPRTFAALLVQANRPQWSFGDALLYTLGTWLGSATLPTVRLLLATAGSVLMAIVLVKYADGSNLAETAALLMLVGLLALPLAFYSHYLTPVIALAALARDGRIRWLVLGVAFAAMVNAVLGVDSLAGGLSGPLLDITGSCVVIAGVGIGLLVARATPPARVQAA